MNYEVKSDIFEKKHQRKIQKLIDALQLKPLVKVKIRKTGKLSNGVYRHCHHNAIEVASKLGGKVVTGYVVTRYNDLTTTSLLPHSVWLSPENKYVDVTYNNHIKEEDFDFYPCKIYNPRDEILVTTNTYIIFDDVHKGISIYDYKNEFLKNVPLNFFVNVKRSLDKNIISNFGVACEGYNISNDPWWLKFKEKHPNPFNLKKSFVSYQTESEAV